MLVTRLSEEKAAPLLARWPKARWHPEARIFHLPQGRPRAGRVAVTCAGTSDLPVAEEAALTAEAMGATVARIYDVGVAGLHRLLRRRSEIQEAHVAVAVAGMEGALASRRGWTGGHPGSGGADQRRATERTSRACPRSSPCSTPAPPTWRW